MPHRAKVLRAAYDAHPERFPPPRRPGPAAAADRRLDQPAPRAGDRGGAPFVGSNRRRSDRRAAPLSQAALAVPEGAGS